MNANNLITIQDFMDAVSCDCAAVYSAKHHRSIVAGMDVTIAEIDAAIDHDRYIDYVIPR